MIENYKYCFMRVKDDINKIPLNKTMWTTKLTDK